MTSWGCGNTHEIGHHLTDVAGIFAGHFGSGISSGIAKCGKTYDIGHLIDIACVLANHDGSGISISSGIAKGGNMHEIGHHLIDVGGSGIGISSAWHFQRCENV